MRFRFRIESSDLSHKSSSLVNSFAGAKPTARRFSLMNGASLPLALALGTTLCGGALLAGPLQAAPTVGSDENGPQVQILSPSYQDVIKGSFRIAVAVTAKNYNPEFIEMLVDDKSATEGPIPISAVGTAAGPAAFDWDTRKFSDGPHKLTVRVTDKQGFRGWAEVNIFINNNRAVDTLPPSLIWQNLENFTAVSGRAQIQLDAKDNFGVKMLMVTINPTNAPNKKPAVGTWLFNRPPYIVNFDTTRVPDGLYTLKANAWDSMEQQGEATQMTIGVINNPINARSIGESLEGLQSFENAVANPKPQPQAVQPLPREVKPGTQTFAGFEKLSPTLKSSTPKVELKTPVEPLVPAQASPLSTKPRQGALTPQTNSAEPVKAPAFEAKLTPSAPSFGVRALPSVNAPKPEVVAAVPAKPPVATVATPKATTAQTPVKIAKATEPVKVAEAIKAPEQTEVAEAPVETLAAPQLSAIEVKAEPVATLDLSPIENSASGVASENSPRLAMLNTNDLTMRESVSLPNTPVEVDAPSLSKAVEVERTARVSAIETQIDAGQIGMQGRASSPTLPTRLVQSMKSLASFSTPSKKVEVAALPANEVQEQTTVAQPTLSQRWILPKLAVAQPVVSKTPKVEASRVGFATKPVVVAPAVVETASIASQSEPKLSAPKVVAPKISDTQATKPVRGGLSKVVRKPIQSTPKVEIPEQPVLAALPKGTKTVVSGHSAAITVSPIEVEARSMPAVHRVERTTTLRAVAARYGLPVELVAACNVWPVEMNVVKGMTVKLPRPLQVSYNGAPVDSDAQSMLVGDTAVAAFRFMFEKSGGTMKWDAKAHRVIAKKGETEIALTIGSKTAKVGDKEVMMELAAFLFEGRTMVPIRLFEEGLRAEIEWDPQTGRMVVAMINSTAPGVALNG